MKKTKPCNVPCPKCGSTDIYREFQRKGNELDLPYGDQNEQRANQFIRINGWLDAKVLADCIMHHCRCCQFDWETAPL